MPKAKSYLANQVALISTQPPTSEARVALVPLPINPSAKRSIDLSGWLGQGFDGWVWACTGMLQTLLRSGSVMPATVAAYGANGIPSFFAFLVQFHGPAHPGQLRREHLERFISWLRLKSAKLSTAKTRYALTKSVLMGLIDQGLIDTHPRDLFPRNPFTGAHKFADGQSPLSLPEIKRLANALKDDLIAIHQGGFGETDSQALAVSFLVIAMRTGLNTTPQLEAARDSLGPNAFAPNMMVMRTFKRRGNSTHLKSLRFSEEQDTVNVIPMDGVAVMKKVLELTADLVSQAPSELQNRIWLYRSESGSNSGMVTALTNQTLGSCVQAIVTRHQLLGDDGKPLRVNNQRLRKTMESRLWRLSNGDLVTVATVMGHAPAVADYSYLHLSDEMKAEAAQFVGETLPAILRGDGSYEENIPASLRDTLQTTPTGRCKNTLHGQKAPHDGSHHCAQFTECVGCPTFVVVGTVEDLHRLFSFQQFLHAEIGYMPGSDWKDWRDHHAALIDLIDRFTGARFPLAIVSEAKRLAEREPHRFWAMRIEQARRAAGEMHDV